MIKSAVKKTLIHFDKIRNDKILGEDTGKID